MVNVWAVLSEGQLRTEEKREKEIETDREGNVIATLKKVLVLLTIIGYLDK